MPTPPTLLDVKAYLGPDQSWTDAQIGTALASEIVAQAARVRFPTDPVPPAEPLDYPADLAEALYRRVAAALAMRSLPLGVQAAGGDGAIAVTRVGGGDREVSRLEAPYRRMGTFG